MNFKMLNQLCFVNQEARKSPDDHR